MNSHTIIVVLFTVAHLVGGLTALLRKHDADFAAVEAHTVEAGTGVVRVALGLELHERKALWLTAYT